jgi:hypothetical protein
VLDLAAADGKTYRVGQCRRCGRVFWGVKGEPSPAERRYLGECVSRGIIGSRAWEGCDEGG